MEQWIAKAEHALRTGQPRLAELYMRRGLSESASGRYWLAWRDFMAAMFDAGSSVVAFLRSAGLMDDDPSRPDYALAGPSKAGS
jgi:hypothetical protein